MSQKKRVEILVVKERTGELTFLNQFMKGFRFLAETVLFIGVGAIVTTWEKIAKILKSGNEGQTNPPLQPSRLPDSPAPARLAVKVKVPLLPIDNYQQLTAEQVIGRIKGLSPDQLESVRHFESAHRNRKSVLEVIGRLMNRGES